MDPITRHNQQAWDQLARRGSRHARVATLDELAAPLATLDAEGWLGGSVAGARVLCLAAGGGYQSALFAAAGARVTVVDLSEEMLERDRQQAALHGWELRCLQCSMDRLADCDDGSFEIVWHPVSTCYVPDVLPTFREVARVLCPGGVYISQHKQPASLQISADREHYALTEPYYRQGPLPPLGGTALREEGTLEYLHSWEALLGGMCRAGLAIEDLVEPCHADPHAAHGSFAHRALQAPPYVRVKARRREGRADDDGSRLWTPSRGAEGHERQGNA